MDKNSETQRMPLRSFEVKSYHYFFKKSKFYFFLVMIL